VQCTRTVFDELHVGGEFAKNAVVFGLGDEGIEVLQDDGQRDITEVFCA
jgi:hypothetical protein